VTFTSQASGGQEPFDYEYQFLIKAPGTTTYTATGGYILVPDGGGATWLWDTSGEVPGTYTVMVYARSAGSQLAYEKSRAVTYTITEAAPVESVKVTADKASPQGLGAVGTVRFTAVPTGGVLPEYQFWLYDKTSGKYWLKQEYGVGDFWDWTPGAADYYVVRVYARSSQSVASYEKAATLAYYVTVNPPVTSVALTASPTSPRPPGTSVTFTATPTGGVSPEYRFYLRPPGATAYQPVGNLPPVDVYAADNTWFWNTAGAAAGTYTVLVYARSAGSIAPYEKSRTISFKIQ
jgi:hypothetical protein